MGMGDKKKVILPEKKRHRCLKCGNVYVETAVRQCKHPSVMAVYGEAYICQYCCSRKPCEHFERDKLSGAASCNVERKE